MIQKKTLQYNPKCEGMRIVFDCIYYKLIPKIGIKCSAIALPGHASAIARYVAYLKDVVADYPKTKLFFLELDEKKCKDMDRNIRIMKQKGSGIAKKITIENIDIVSYLRSVTNREYPPRLIDAGIGLRIDEMAEEGRILLNWQKRSKARNIKRKKRTKILILDANVDRIKHEKIIKALNTFIYPLKTKVEDINGCDIKDIGGLKKIFLKGIRIGRKRKDYNERAHVVKLTKNKHNAEMMLFTYKSNEKSKSGGKMLTIFLLYR